MNPLLFCNPYATPEETAEAEPSPRPVTSPMRKVMSHDFERYHQRRTEPCERPSCMASKFSRAAARGRYSIRYVSIMVPATQRLTPHVEILPGATRAVDSFDCGGGTFLPSHVMTCLTSLCFFSLDNPSHPSDSLLQTTSLQWSSARTIHYIYTLF